MVHLDPAFSKEAMVSTNVPLEDRAIIHKKLACALLYLQRRQNRQQIDLVKLICLEFLSDHKKIPADWVVRRYALRPRRGLTPQHSCFRLIYPLSKLRASRSDASRRQIFRLLVISVLS
jgi:hypothetical protein